LLQQLENCPSGGLQQVWSAVQQLENSPPAQQVVPAAQQLPPQQVCVAVQQLVKFPLGSEPEQQVVPAAQQASPPSPPQPI
jgi:hypothetical protein